MEKGWRGGGKARRMEGRKAIKLNEAFLMDVPPASRQHRSDRNIEIAFLPIWLKKNRTVFARFFFFFFWPVSSHFVNIAGEL